MENEQKPQMPSNSPVESAYAHLLTHDISKPVGVLITAIVMFALAFLANMTNAPNPNMILISGLVICGAFFGYPGGIAAAVIMMAYTLFFFSTNHDCITFTEQNFQKVLVSAFGIAVVTFFVSTLRLTISKTVGQLQRVNDTLEENNQLLEVASATDSLTGARNRFALRRDFSGYLDQPLNVMMLDVDNFKELNDTFGHSTGDYALNQIGRFLIEAYSESNVYRYGGDEFLVICPHEGPDEFERDAVSVKERVSSIVLDKSSAEKVHLSGGYVYGTPSIQSDLRLMIRQADANLYDSKDAGKDRIIGCEFSRMKAEQAQDHQSGARGRFPHPAADSRL